ncbi:MULTISPECIES: RNA polymerase sigma-70 factor [Variovorax]|jgi:RNA polymerase sigma-70 factor (ECF subfamily)|uniref:RNA polymerase sigma-70 factor n=1 Tax=Variovorax TaxID=34072 RepID=UPI0008979C63|nr:MULTISPECIES: RNA polymerase sigma-70 factor [Variovorax]MDQ0081471.1 RNA polymerase sigma-70 factor (ECF subfamily) [Variovorax boronicumulans]SDX74075.1 RNA polymerase sigma-70 factor, ECF subfamily [Variovorax sp. YR634]SDY99363.1 RNA polymerase sigma-70 factor, ECF subfamily [Variovorax sp. YR266]
MDDATLTFDRHRPRLQGIAYRMLGSMAEAEEVVQDAWLRWHEAAKDTFDSAEAWLVTVVTRLSIDRLRAAKVQREHYIGAWMPEPMLTEAPDTPEQLLERADNISVAFLAVLERLAPEARAAFLLREVFDADYEEVARTLGKSEAACRQLVHRAKVQVQEGRPRFTVPRETHERLLRAFADAAARGSLQDLKALMAEDVELIGDGGGKVQTFSKILRGSQRLAQLYYSLWRRMGPAVRMEMVDINGEPGMLRFLDGELESAQTFEIENDRIVRIRAQRNPDKLARIAQLFSSK